MSKEKSSSDPWEIALVYKQVFEAITLLNRKVQELDEVTKNLKGALTEHMGTEFTKAHPRTGDFEKVQQYLGDGKVDPPSSVEKPEEVI
jgi:hypothetical protein